VRTPSVLNISRLTFKYYLATEKLSHHAPDRPHVDLVRVGFAPQQQLGSSVPQSHHFVGEQIFKFDFAAESEICEFDVSFVVEEDVGGLDIAVEYFVAVEVGDAFEELAYDVLDFG
jgi:hypothetical protein